MNNQRSFNVITAKEASVYSQHKEKIKKLSDFEHDSEQLVTYLFPINKENTINLTINQAVKNAFANNKQSATITGADWQSKTNPDKDIFFKLLPSSLEINCKSEQTITYLGDPFGTYYGLEVLGKHLSAHDLEKCRQTRYMYNPIRLVLCNLKFYASDGNTIDITTRKSVSEVLWHPVKRFNKAAQVANHYKLTQDGMIVVYEGLCDLIVKCLKKAGYTISKVVKPTIIDGLNNSAIAVSPPKIEFNWKNPVESTLATDNINNKITCK